MKKYECIADYQTGDWCVGVVEDAKGWLERAVGWRDSDDSFESDAERRKFIAYWNHKIKVGEEWDLIEYIADMWSIGIKEAKE